MPWPRTATLCLVAALAFGCAQAPKGPAPAAQPSWVPVTPQDLLGSWKLRRVDSQTMRGEFTLTFRADGRVSGTLNCGNQLMGGYHRLAPHILRIGGSVTERGCDVPPLLAAAEKSLLSPSSAYLSPDRRNLFLAGLRTLQFTRAD